MPETVTELLDVGEKASVPFSITVADAGAETDSKRAIPATRPGTEGGPTGWRPADFPDDVNCAARL